MTEPDPLATAVAFARVLEAHGIAYVLAGSVASTVWGEARATLDVDFATRLEARQVEGLVAELEGSFWLDRAAVEEAVELQRSFNAIEKSSMVKVDAYVRPDRGIHAQEFRRARRIELLPGEEVSVASPEDVLLQKLRWYREGDEVSDRQWRDVVGILKTSGPALDASYLREWSVELGIRDLLDRALAGTGLPPLG